jgi:alkanesulfonate monooxygenase SsuD/methylene tetrahydromethanopterin reductase-like flavin-dependent oxidoreductase (luciferase family)
LFDARHFKLEMTPVRADIPILFASLQEKAVTDIGRVADGWIPTFWPYEHFEDGVAWMRAGAVEAGRDPDALELAPFMAVVPFDDLAMARGLIKPLVSFYIGGMGTYYHALFCRYGFKENADLVRELYNAGDRKRAASEVSDALIDAIAICGPAEQCHERLADWRRHGVGTALMNLPMGVPPDMTEHFLRNMAPR